MFHLAHIVKTFGQVRVLDDVSLSVAPGQTTRVQLSGPLR